MTDMTMGQRIAECRKKRNLSQEALGDKMGVSRQAISKWESDGAVPEIDKLIALSKLFGVSVGWLLGVEEAEPQKPDGLTDAQLKMVEEIVRRYQPRPAPEPEPEKRTPLWLKALATVAVVIVAWAALAEISQQQDQNAASISSLNGSYSTIQNQLSILAARLDELTAGEKLLSDYSVEAAAWDDAKGAFLTFTMTPRSWNENDTAYVAVRHSGSEVDRFACTWDGTACRAEVSVSALDGYEYYYIVCHPDGTQEQELMSSGYQNVARGLDGNYTVTCNDAQISGGNLIFNGYSMDVTAPVITRTDTVYLESMVWIVTVNGEEYFRQDVFTEWYWDHYDNLHTSGTGAHKFPLPEISDGDEVLLSVEIGLSDGTRKLVDALQFQRQDGTWLQAEFAPATDY